MTGGGVEEFSEGGDVGHGAGEEERGSKVEEGARERWKGRSWPFLVRTSLEPPKRHSSTSSKGWPLPRCRATTAMMQRVTLAATDLGDHRGQPVSWKGAHAVLTQMRNAHGGTMTDSDTFNWRAYLANRPGTEALLRGAHVSQFAFVWTRAWDHNRKEHRGDFLVRLTDGRDIRLHPQQRKNRDGAHEAHPVEGHWEHWALNSPPDGREIDVLGVLAPLQDQTAHAPPPGGSQPVSWTQTYRGGSQADKVSQHTARNFLKHVVAAWQARPYPRGPFRRDITDVADGRRFDWHSFLFGNPVFADAFQEGDTVARVEIAWVRDLDQLAFIVHRGDGWVMTAGLHGWRWGDRGDEGQ